MIPSALETKAIELAARASAFCGSSDAVRDFLKSERLMLLSVACQHAVQPNLHEAALINLQRAAEVSSLLNRLYGDESWV